jgi:hypothetical protein
MIHSHTLSEISESEKWKTCQDMSYHMRNISTIFFCFSLFAHIASSACIYTYMCLRVRWVIWISHSECLITLVGDWRQTHKLFWVRIRSAFYVFIVIGFFFFFFFHCSASSFSRDVVDSMHTVEFRSHVEKYIFFCSLFVSFHSFWLAMKKNVLKCDDNARKSQYEGIEWVSETEKKKIVNLHVRFASACVE